MIGQKHGSVARAVPLADLQRVQHEGALERRLHFGDGPTPRAFPPRLARVEILRGGGQTRANRPTKVGDVAVRWRQQRRHLRARVCVAVALTRKTGGRQC